MPASLLMMLTRVSSTSFAMVFLHPQIYRCAPPSIQLYNSFDCCNMRCCTYNFSFWSLENAVFILVSNPVSNRESSSLWYKKSEAKCWSPKNNQFLPGHLHHRG